MDQMKRLLAGDDEGREAVRAVAALLVGLGFAMLVIRKSGSLGEHWGDFPLLIALLIPAAALYGAGFTASQVTGPRPWQPVAIVFGLFFIAASLYQLVELLGGSPDSPLNTFWIFAVLAGAAFLAGFRADVRFALLAGGISVLISLLGLFDELLPNGLVGDIGTFRGICMLITIGLGGFGFLLIRRDPLAGGRRGGELLTSAGIAFVLGAGFASASGLGSAFVPTPFGTSATAPASGNASLFWDLVLLAGSIVLIVAGARFDARGPCYVGAVGLLTFLLVAGFDLDDPTPEPSLLGWPLVLLVAGALAFALSIQGAVKLGPRQRAAPGEATAVHDSRPVADPPPDRRGGAGEGPPPS